MGIFELLLNPELSNQKLGIQLLKAQGKSDEAIANIICRELLNKARPDTIHVNFMGLTLSYIIEAEFIDSGWDGIKYTTSMLRHYCVFVDWNDLSDGRKFVCPTAGNTFLSTFKQVSEHYYETVKPMVLSIVQNETLIKS